MAYNFYKNSVGKPKFWDNHPEVLGRVKRVNEDIWFRQQQSLLLWMVNSDYGRDLLCIDKSFPKIIEISKKHITGILGVDNSLVYKISDFRIGAKWANVIRHRWQEFQEYATYYYALKRGPILFPVIPQKSYAYTVTTVFPDPNPETTTVDGVVGRASVDEAFGTIRGGAGTNVDDSTGDNLCDRITTSTTTDQFAAIFRGVFLFDTSSIPDTDVISAATYSFATNSKADPATAINPTYNVYTSTPASNTGLAASDYGQIAAVAQGTDLTHANVNTDGTTYNDIIFNATGRGNISQTGVSKFATRESTYDAPNSAPTWSSNTVHGHGMLYAETAGTSTDPKLAVTHAVAVTEFGGLLMLSYL